jgi:glycosyltransferase involved in cell wall biosynthesis
VYAPEATLPSFQRSDVRTSFLQKWARWPRLHKLALPFYPAAFEHFDLSGYDVVLSSTTGFAKGVVTGPETCHICYCHTPARFAWRYHEYVSRGGYGRGIQQVLPWMVHRLREWDYSSAQRVDYFIANSFTTAARIRNFYRREADVIHAPVDTKRFHVKEAPAGDYFLVVSRLVGYKRVDLAVEAMNRLRLPLKVVGTGPDLARLKALAGPTVEFLGHRPDEEVAELLADCRALLFPGEEDFGITPLEAMASGRPVIAYGAGGALETVTEGETGLFFDAPTPESLIQTVRRFEEVSFSPHQLRAFTEHFDVEAFQRRLLGFVEMRYAEYRATYTRLGGPPARPRSSGAAEPALLASKSYGGDK